MAITDDKSKTIKKEGIPVWVFGVGVAVIVLLFLLLGVVVNVPAGSVGVLFDSLRGGVQSQVLGQGWNVAIPIIQRINVMEVRTQKVEYPAEAASKDLQIVDSTVAISYHIVPSTAPKLYNDLGGDFADKIIAPGVQEKFKANTAKFNAEELIQRRELVKAAIAEDMTTLLDKYGIKVDEVSITNFRFSPEFNSAIEAKVVAQQQELTAENILAIKQVEAQQKIAEAVGVANSTVLKAQANAQAVKLNGEAQAYALKVQRQEVSSTLVSLRTVEKWNGQLPQFMAGGNANPFIVLNANQAGVDNGTSTMDVYQNNTQ